MKRALLFALFLPAVFKAAADEGLWLYNQPPRELLRQRHQFDATDQWLEHLQKSSIRFSYGGSASFVSRNGLLITNHHIGSGALEEHSTKERDLVRTGFCAHSLAEEIKCTDIELNVLDSIEDVTARVNAAVPKTTDSIAAFQARRKVIAEIEKQSLDKTGLRSDVVTLWQGGAYHLYRYKRYTDVRLVFAPEAQSAYFGGDPDNFEFPRYDLDVCLFRAYEDGKPARIHHYLRFSPTGPRDGELVFVSGSPGWTSRLLTVAELENSRDQWLPIRLKALKSREVLLSNWSNRSLENSRRAKGDLFGVANSRKHFDGVLAGLLDPGLISAKAKSEADFKTRMADKLQFADALAAYDRIAIATKTLAGQAIRHTLLEDNQGFRCESFWIARRLLRAGDERPKPNGERLDEFSDSGKVSLELGLFSEEPIYTDLEKLRLADSLTYLAGELDVSDPLVQRVLAGKSPRDRAAELIEGTHVGEIAFREKLYEGGAKAVSEANDPMIELARLVDQAARQLRKVSEAQTEAKHQAHAAIAQARNALLGLTGYPDATGTLRLSFGVVKGYEENGSAVPALTTLDGLYAREAEMKGRSPFDLPPLWIKHKAQLNLKTPFNFVSTADIVGGNSGSPVVNRAGEFIGIIFDGNLQSLAWDYAFDENQSRSIAVDSAAILEALDKVYSARELVNELVTRAKN